MLLIPASSAGRHIGIMAKLLSNEGRRRQESKGWRKGHTPGSKQEKKIMLSAD